MGRPGPLPTCGPVSFRIPPRGGPGIRCFLFWGTICFFWPVFRPSPEVPIISSFPGPAGGPAWFFLQPFPWARFLWAGPGPPQGLSRPSPLGVRLIAPCGFKISPSGPWVGHHMFTPSRNPATVALGHLSPFPPPRQPRRWSNQSRGNPNFFCLACDARPWTGPRFSNSRCPMCFGFLFVFILGGGPSTGVMLAMVPLRLAGRNDTHFVVGAPATMCSLGGFSSSRCSGAALLLAAAQ